MRDPTGRDGIFTVEGGWDFGFLGGAGQTVGTVLDLDTNIDFKYQQDTGFVGPFIGGGVAIAGWGYYSGEFADFLSSDAIRVSLAVVEVNVNFNRKGFTGLSLVGGLSTTVGVAYATGQNKAFLKAPPCP